MSAASVSFVVADWNRSRTRAQLANIPGRTTIGELLSELRDSMRLPREAVYHLIHGGEKLSRTATVEEAGIAEGEEVTIAPEVSAG